MNIKNHSPFCPDGIRLLFLGFTTLFLELILIRYLGANIWNMGYFPNLVVIAVFFGMGLGFLFHHAISMEKSHFFLHLSFILLMFLVLFVVYKHPSLPLISDSHSQFAGEIFFIYTPTQGADTRLTPFLFLFFSTVSIFFLISQRTAKLFQKFKPLTAYTLDIAGSCLGILSFMAISFFQFPPWVWFSVLTLLFMIAMADSWKSRWIVLAPALIILAHSYHYDSRHLRYPELTESTEVTWSPYQRVEFINDSASAKYLIGTIWVNGMGHQGISPLEHLQTSIYNMPYQDRQDNGLLPAKNVLVIGAGCGNDTAVALLWNVEHVDAVEIDPAIASLGRRYHPLQPFSDPRVNLVIGDGRAFMATAKRQYDIIVIAWADSVVRASSMSQLRLENYLYTRESMAQGYRLLSDTGAMYVFNTFSMPSVGIKVLGMIQQAVGFSPIVVSETKSGFHKFKFGKTADFRSELPRVDASVDIPTDDWPFLHLINKGIPSFYLRVMVGMALFIGLLMIVIHLLTARVKGMNQSGMTFLKLSFFLMGTAFLLLETKSIIQFSLLFGATWINSSLVFLSVLLLVLAANWSASLLKSERVLPWIFLMLTLSTLAPLAYPLGNLLKTESGLVRFVIASLMTFSPIFFANLVFSMIFRNQTVPAHLFGWNLLGAMMGGVLEYVSMAVGYNLLAIIVAACYLLTFYFLRLAQKRQKLTVFQSQAATADTDP